MLHALARCTQGRADTGRSEWHKPKESSVLVHLEEWQSACSRELQITTAAAAQCSLKRGRMQARFRKKFLSDGCCSTRSCSMNMCSSKFLSFDGWWVEPGYESCQSVLQNLDPKSMAHPHRKFLAEFDTCGC